MDTILSLATKRIDNLEVRHVVTTFLEQVPEYFWHMPASTTGKYHPAYALGEGGVVRHTKAAFYIAEELFVINDFSDYEKDIIRAAILLHDTFKKGWPEQQYTVADHPVIAAKKLVECFAEGTREEIVVSRDIAWLIYTHMGQWNKRPDGTEFAPVPETKLQRFVAMCDYLASRKCIEFNFDAVK